MEDIAQVYARSLFEVAKEKGSLEDVRGQIGEVADALESNRDFAQFLYSPYFSSKEKKDGLEKAVEGADVTVQNFLELLIENHRMPVLLGVRRELDALWEQEHELLPVHITSAVELDPSVAERLGEEVGRQTGREVELTSTVDPDVLGGLVLRVGNQILDASVRTRLEGLRREVARS